MRIEVGDIVAPGAEAVINPANGCGVMGAGVAGALSQYGGSEVEEAAKALKKANGKPFEPGECYVTDAGALRRRGIKKIYHAVVMKYPGGFTSIDIVGKALTRALDMAIGDNVSTIAVPGMGTGIGKLDKRSVAGVMYGKIMEVEPFIEVIVIDRNAQFIDEMKSFCKR